MEQPMSEIPRSSESKKSDNKRNKEMPTQEEVEHLRQQMEALQTENRSLKERLLDMGVPIEQTSLSDSEKEQLLLRRSASGSMASLDNERKESCQCGVSIGSTARAESSEHLASSGGELDVCEMPGPAGTLEDPSLGRTLLDWDKASSSSLSEMSVACLQDRIMQMEETHYSTSEELQATLQELTDLQDQLTDLQMDNDRMGEEKTVLLESLCSQTEKLEDCRSQIQHLKQLLLQNFEEGLKSDHPMVTSDRELHYLQLLKNAQEEQESLLQKHEELSASLQASKDQSVANVTEFLHLKDRVRFLESTIESVHADRRLIEEHLAESQEQISAGQIEIGQLRLQLETEQQRVKDLQRERDASATSELESLLQETRNDKEKTEEKLLQLQEQLSFSQREVTRLKEQLSQLQEEAMVSKNNAHKQVSDLQYLMSQLESGKVTLQKENDLVSEALRQSEAKCQRHLEDKRELIANVSEMQKALAERQVKLKELTRELEQSKEKLSKDTEEWHKFQCDLLTSVRVANDLRMEAHQELERITTESKQMKEKIENLQSEITVLKDRQQELVSAAVSPISHSLPSLHRDSPLRALTPEAGSDLPSAAAAVVASASTAARRQMGTAAKLAGTQLSVRSLIESIENATKQAKEIGLASSRSSSTSSLSSITSESRKIANTLILGSSAGDLFLKMALQAMDILVPAVSKVEQPTSWYKDEIKLVMLYILCEIISRDLELAVKVIEDFREQLQQSGTTTALSDSSSNLKVSGPVIGSLQTCTDNGLYGKSTSNSSPDVSTKNTLLETSGKPHPVSILASKLEPMRRNSFGDLVEKKDPLCALVKGGGSKRNALLKWCQNKTVGYRGIDITNFSSSWNDGLAFCALLHSYLSVEIPYQELDNKDKKRNFSIAFQAAESVGIPTTLNINDLISQERPDWQSIMTYVTSIYKHFET